VNVVAVKDGTPCTIPLVVDREVPYEVVALTLK
jgi:hypothetical protein